MMQIEALRHNFAPTKTSRSVPIQSPYEQVVAATPSIARNATLLGAWQIRAALSTIYNDNVPLDRPGYDRRKRPRLSRIPGLPDVPNIAEAGVPSFQRAESTSSL